MLNYMALRRSDLPAKLHHCHGQSHAPPGAPARYSTARAFMRSSCRPA